MTLSLGCPHPIPPIYQLGLHSTPGPDPKKLLLQILLWLQEAPRATAVTAGKAVNSVI